MPFAALGGDFTRSQSDHGILRTARETLEHEAQALIEVAKRIDDGFLRAVRLIRSSTGKVVVMGIGKSGHVGRKIAATLASTGTPSFFVHPGEAGHGDLGMITNNDIVLAISNSGETTEMIALLPALRSLGCKIIAITSKRSSALGRCADAALDSSVAREACPLNLAPTSSAIAQLALGDAVAMALLRDRGFAEEDFARIHPGGALGRLFLKVSDVMRRGDQIPLVFDDLPLLSAMKIMTDKQLGAVIFSEGGRLGVFTDGDLRRLIANQQNVADLRLADVANFEPISIRPDALVSVAANEMKVHGIQMILVRDQYEIVGAISLNDLIKAKLV